MKDVHLFLLIHGLWGRPSHLAAAQHELETAWSGSREEQSDTGNKQESHTAHPSQDGIHTPPDTDGTCPSPSSPETSPLPAEPPQLSRTTTSSSTTLVHSATREDLVVVVAEGMTAQLTYDGVDVCASRVAWEVDQHVARLEAEGCRVTRFSIMGYSLGGLVARYLIGLLEARDPSFFDKHVPISFSTIATPHLGIPRYNTLLSPILHWLGGSLMSRSGEQLHVVDSYSSKDPRPLLEIMADPMQVFHKALSRFSSVDLYANTVNDTTVPYPSAAAEAIDPFVQWADRGLEVDADEAGIVANWHFGEPCLKKKWAGRVGNLPPTLRFRKPYSYIILLLFPILVPLIALLVIARFSLDTRRSRRRLQRLARSPPPEASSGVSATSPIPSPQGSSIDSLRHAIKTVERNLEQDFMDAADTADMAALPALHNALPAHAHAHHASHAGDQLHPTVHVLLNDQQLRMVHWLSALEPTRHRVYLPDVANSHAVVVVRDPEQFPVHERGRGVLKHWAQQVAEVAEMAGKL